MKSIEIIESSVAMTFMDAVPSEEAIRELVDKLRFSFPLNDEEYVQLIKRLHARLSIKMEQGAKLMAEYRPWLAARRAEINPFFWTRYRDFLLKRGWASPVVATLGQITDDILDSMGDPSSEGRWTRRGLVIGDVQSGKTATYTALIAKAADAGYPIVVLLTGTLENLRQQTQERLDEGFVGLASSDLLQTQSVRSNRTIGVGNINPERMAMVFTSVASDFKAATMNQFNFRLDSMRDPVLLVVKKNKSVLENLRNWLRDFNAVNGKIGQPLLLIDDEADNASVNTNVPGADPTQINRLIRELLDLFSRNSYVGFTATPFANIFINPDSPEEMTNDDLFPRDFIYALEAPSNYMGASRVFGEINDGMIREITDAEPAFPKKHRSSFQVSDLPESLRDALRSSLLTCTIRDLRGEGPTHRTMLVNVSRFTDVQMQLQALIAAYLEDVKQDIRSYSALPVSQALRNATLAGLHREYQKEFAASGSSWEQVQNQLHQSVAPIEVRAVNQRTRAASLDYTAHRDTGLRVIAVGGNSLSRGLTLEGLSTSYFYRNSQMYDTLLQMGRWFGYRPGYEDLCRLWMTDEAQDWYRKISEAADELRNDVKRMMRRKATPKDFGLRVRAHPKTLLVTAQNKMRLGETIEIDVSLSEHYQETTRLRRSRNLLQANEEAVKAFLRQLRASGYELRKSPFGKHPNMVCSGVPKQFVSELLQSFTAHPLNLDFNSDLADFVGATTEEKLQSWDVALIDTDNNEEPVNLEGYSIRPFARYVDTNRDGALRISGPKQRVGTPGLEREGLAPELVSSIRDEYRATGKSGSVPDSVYRSYRPRPLLLIFAVTPYKEKNGGGGRLDLGVSHLYALGLSFPEFDDVEIAKKVAYRVNLVEFRSLVESSLDDETEDDVMEAVDED
jgi:Z1 domain